MLRLRRVSPLGARGYKTRPLSVINFFILRLIFIHGECEGRSEMYKREEERNGPLQVRVSEGFMTAVDSSLGRSSIGKSGG